MNNLTEALNTCREIRENISVIKHIMIETNRQLDSLERAYDKLCGSLTGAGRNADHKDEYTKQDIL